MDAVDLDLKKEATAKATLQSILAGSVRPNSRLARSRGLPQSCRCGCHKEDIQHVFQECDGHRAIRDRYDGLINVELNRDVETR